jgi:hypothetical protein
MCNILLTAILQKQFRLTINAHIEQCGNIGQPSTLGREVVSFSRSKFALHHYNMHACEFFAKMRSKSYRHGTRLKIQRR